MTRPFLMTISIFFLVLGCASTKPLDPISVQPVKPEKGQVLAVDDVWVVVDTSGSLEQSSGFPQTKQVVEAFVSALPDDEYDVGLIVFGGDEVIELDRAPFDRESLVMTIDWIDYGGGLSPIQDVIEQVTKQAGEGATAVVLFSDGMATRATRSVGPEGTIAVAEAAVVERSAPLCFYTVRTGQEEGGAVLLQQLSEVGGCGRSLNASSWTDGAVLQDDVRGIMFKTVARPLQGPLDADGDGIVDSKDACPGTPKGAATDERGCWTLPGSSFATGSAALKPKAIEALSAAAQVLSANPEIRIRVEGHTDSTGSAAINNRLSRERADAVRARLIQDGVAPGRIEAEGFGASRPAESNATAAGRAANRRVDLAILR